jgi:hypothetical protein
MLMVATCPTSSRMSVRLAFWKPASSTVRVYSPGRRKGIVYAPCSLVVAVATSLVSWFCTVTVAPGSADWLVSAT